MQTDELEWILFGDLNDTSIAVQHDLEWGIRYANTSLMFPFEWPVLLFLQLALGGNKVIQIDDALSNDEWCDLDCEGGDRQSIGPLAGISMSRIGTRNGEVLVNVTVFRQFSNGSPMTIEDLTVPVVNKVSSFVMVSLVCQERGREIYIRLSDSKTAIWLHRIFQPIAQHPPSLSAVFSRAFEKQRKVSAAAKMLMCKSRELTVGSKLPIEISWPHG